LRLYLFRSTPDIKIDDMAKVGESAGKALGVDFTALAEPVSRSVDETTVEDFLRISDQFLERGEPYPGYNVIEASPTREECRVYAGSLWCDCCSVECSKKSPARVLLLSSSVASISSTLAVATGMPSITILAAPRSHELQNDHFASIVGQVKSLASEPVAANNGESKLSFSHLSDTHTS